MTRSEARSAARTTIAVPCWSSWKTGTSTCSCNRCSTSKHRGAEMSSRLMPPKLGARRATVSTISSTSVVSRHSGTASICAKVLNSTALPSITGMAAAGPMSPSPSTAVPSVTTATVLGTHVYASARAGSAAIASHTRATPGVYASDMSSALVSGEVGVTASLPPRCMAKTASSSGRGSTAMARPSVGVCAADEEFSTPARTQSTPRDRAAGFARSPANPHCPGV